MGSLNYFQLRVTWKSYSFKVASPTLMVTDSELLVFSARHFATRYGVSSALFIATKYTKPSFLSSVIRGGECCVGLNQKSQQKSANNGRI